MTPLTDTQFVNTEIPRDRWGRPMILPPKGKKRVAYRRVTTFVGCLEDTYNLMNWKNRQVAYGMGQRKDLILASPFCKQRTLFTIPPDWLTVTVSERSPLRLFKILTLNCV